MFVDKLESMDLFLFLSSQVDIRLVGRFKNEHKILMVLELIADKLGIELVDFSLIIYEVLLDELRLENMGNVFFDDVAFELNVLFIY